MERRHLNILPVISLVFYGFCVLIEPLPAQNSPRPQETKEDIFTNPFLIDGEYAIVEIDDLEANQRWAGFTDNPENLFVRFKVRGQGGSVIPNIPSENFYYQIRRQGRSYEVEATTRYQGDGYFARLPMPRVADSGNYDFLISVREKPEENSPWVSRAWEDFFGYQQRKTDVVFLIDNSGSMNRNDPKRLRYEAIYRVLQNPRFSRKIDELAVISFSENANTVFPFGRVSAFLKKKVLLPGAGDTDYSKPFLLAEQMIQEHRRRDFDQKAVIFLTDGVANYPYAGEHLRMRNLGISVYTVGVFGKDKSREYQPDFLRLIARETRGDFFEVEADVLERVFQKFIDLSSSPSQKFLVIPLKERYAYNELIHLDYRASDIYEKGLAIEALLHYPDGVRPAPVYARESGRVTLYPVAPADSAAAGTGDSLPHSLRVVFRGGKTVLFDETIALILGHEPDIGVDGIIHFPEIDFHNYDIRYFPLINRSQEESFVDILLPHDGGFLPDFKEIPFLLLPGEKRFQGVVFRPQSEIVSGNGVIEFILQTSRGDFLNQINYGFLSRAKITPVSPLISVKNPSNQIWFLFLGINALFFILIGFKLRGKWMRFFPPRKG